MSNPRFNDYSSSIGGSSDYSSTYTPPSTSGPQYVDYSSQGAPYIPSTTQSVTSSYTPPVTSTVYHTQTSSNLFGGYQTRRHHDHGTQHVDEVRYQSCCTIV